ncbi:MAG: hypothetical protein NVS3B20_27200 [Polyangiales bacterium]
MTAAVCSTVALQPTGDPSSIRVTLVDLRGDALSIMSMSAAPPGARIDLELTHGESSSQAFRLKVSNCRKQSNGFFLIDGRILDPSRALREALAALVIAAGPEVSRRVSRR